MAEGMTKVNFYTDASLKAKAEKVFEQMGLNMTTALNLFLKSSVQSGELPFIIRTDEAANRKRIHKALMEAQLEANDPNTKWIEEDDFFAGIDKKYGL